MADLDQVRESLEELLPLSLDTPAFVELAHQEGFNDNQIAKRLGHARSSVGRWHSRESSPRRTEVDRINNDLREMVIEMHLGREAAINRLDEALDSKTQSAS